MAAGGQRRSAAAAVALAGNGWLRGVQDLRRPVRYVLAGSLVSLVLCPLLVHPVGWGLVGSAVANVAGQAVSAACFGRALARELRRLGIDWRPRPAALRGHLVLGRDLLLRAVVLQLAFAVATAVVARSGTAQLGAHQVALQLWLFLALVLDAYAIAAQTLVGHALGAERAEDARRTARRVAAWGLGTGWSSPEPCWHCSRCCPRCSPTTPPSSPRPPSSGGSSPSCSRWPGSCSRWTVC